MLACRGEAVDSLIASGRFFAGDSGPQMPIDSAEWLDSEAACKAAPLPSSLNPGRYGPGVGSPAVPVWLIAPCGWYGLGGVAPGTVGA